MDNSESVPCVLVFHEEIWISIDQIAPILHGKFIRENVHHMPFCSAPKRLILGMQMLINRIVFDC